MQFLSENRLNACQIFGRFNFVKTESKPTFGFLHIPSFHVSARPDWHYVLNLFTCSSVTKFLNMTLWKHMNGVWCKSVHEWSTRKQLTLGHRRSKLKVTSSINLDADWSIIPRLRDAIIMHSVSKYKQTSMVYLQSSSRTRVMNHNWSATKQSVAEISRYSVFSGDRIRQCETLSGSRHKDTDQCL